MKTELENAKKLLQEVLNELDLTTYCDEDDEIGRRSCCDVISYKPHEKNCIIVRIKKFLKQE